MYPMSSADKVINPVASDWTAHVRDEYSSTTLALELFGELRDTDARRCSVFTMAPVDPRPITDVAKYRETEQPSCSTAKRFEAPRDGLKSAMKYESGGFVRKGVNEYSSEIEPQKLTGPHVHAARKRRRHGIHAGQEFRD